MTELQLRCDMARGKEAKLANSGAQLWLKNVNQWDIVLW